MSQSGTTISIAEHLAAEEPSMDYVSFEFFPPRTEQTEDTFLHTNLPLFEQQSPVFLDMTWGAGGSTSGKTMELCKTMQARYPHIPVNMHLTCTNMPAGLINEALNYAKENNIRNIVALRGDPPAGEEFVANPDGLSCARDLVTHIRATHGDYFCITVAGYPEGHCSKLNDQGTISEADYQAEIQYLKSKVDAGANLIITQLFYDAQLFIRFVKECRQAGITVPIIPGLLPVTGYDSLMRMVKLCKTYLPDGMKSKVEDLKDDSIALRKYGVEQCVQLIREIQAADIGVRHFHFYTINAVTQTFEVMKQLGIYKE